jgi:cell division protein FtsB
MRHILPIAIVVFIIAALSIFVFGDSGMLAYDSLAAYKESLTANVDSLKQHNAELTSRLERLRKDPDSNVVLAQGIGLYRPDDVVVRLEGRSAQTETYTVGDLLRMRKDTGLRNPIFKAVALGIAGLLLAFAFFSSRTARSRANGSQSR